MGKPFKKELTLLPKTINWSKTQDIKNLQKFFEIDNHLPLLSIGSGGSFSACHYASLLYENKYYLSKALTPLDFFYSKKIIPKSKVLFISASGKNTDIQFAFKKNHDFGAKIYGNLSMQAENPLKQMSEEFSNSFSINYDLPTGKDGFLATNSLIAFFVLLYRAFNQNNNIDPLQSIDTDEYLQDILLFAEKAKNICNFTVLYGGWGLPVAYDIESKFTEAALGSVQLSDYRNFGHGRHHWFDKKKTTSSIIAIVTPTEKKLAEKTLSYIPSEIPILLIETKVSSSLGSIDLLIKSFHLVSTIGDIRGIDPGKPGVPAFGSKLYNLKYSSFYRTEKKELDNKNTSILRKAHVSSFNELSSIEINAWSHSYETFITKINATTFSGIVFDYDGTLCNQSERLKTELTPTIKAFLINLLTNGIKVGIVTGRGKSIKKLLKNSIPNSFWSSLYIGYYNGFDTGTLDDDSLPNLDLSPEASLKTIKDILLNNYILDPVKFKLDLRPAQLTITSNSITVFNQLREICNQIISNEKISNVIVLESSHSLDIIIKPDVSKLNLIKKFFNNENILCIGDKGSIPGNDSELLSTSYSLSVDEVSYHPEVCWNLIPTGYMKANKICYYLESISIGPTGTFKLNLIQ